MELLDILFIWAVNRNLQLGGLGERSERGVCRYPRTRLCEAPPNELWQGPRGGALVGGKALGKF